jgi:Holliday junction resolvase-like predicted endonuclease
MWSINSGSPQRIDPSRIDLEKDLEDWIEQDPSLLQSDLTIVGRQMQTAAGPLDLIGLDVQGRWTVVEVKRGTIRRDTIAQAIDYASCIASMDWAELRAKTEKYLRSRGTGKSEDSLRLLSLQSDGDIRDMAIIVVGTGRDQGLERIVDFLAQTGSLPITVASFEVFEPHEGQRVLVRELTESDEKSVSTPRSTVSVDDILQRAMALPTGALFKKIHEAAAELGLYARPWKHCIMYTHPSSKNKTLFTVWIESWKANGDQLYLASDAFAEFFGLSSDQASEMLGAKEWLPLDSTHVGVFIEGLRAVTGEAMSAA